MCLRQGPCEHRRDERHDPGGNQTLVPSDGSCAESKGTLGKNLSPLSEVTFGLRCLSKTHGKSDWDGGQGMGKKTPETHLLRFLSHLRRRDDSGVGSVLGAPHKLRLGQLLSAVLLHSLSLQLGDASVLGPEDLG